MSVSPILRHFTSRHFFRIALAVSCLMTLATIVLLHRENTPNSISLIRPVLRDNSHKPVQAPVKPDLNITTISSGTLSVRVPAQKGLATHVFDIPFEGLFQIQVLVELFGGMLEQPVRIQVLVDYMHRIELQEVSVKTAATLGWLTVGATALHAGNVRVSVQRIDSAATAILILNSIRMHFMGSSNFLGGEDCLATEIAPDTFYSNNVYTCPRDEEVAFLDEKGELRSETCAQSDLVVLVPSHNSTLEQVDLEKSEIYENFIVQCKSKDAKSPASFISRLVKKVAFAPPSQGLQSQKISVVHIFMDSIARAVGIMKLPKTMSLLRNIRHSSSDPEQWQLLDMRGYSVLGGGTNRNMPPMVSGTDGRDTPAWNEPGWLFNDFRDKKYVTGFVGDECVLDHNSMVRMMSQEWSGSGSKFSHELKKELRQKADALAHHTLYNVICGVQEYGDLDENWYSGSHLCFSGKPVAEHLFEYGRKFLSAYSDRDKFLWFSIQEGHEPQLLRIETIDESLHNFLRFVLMKFSGTRTIVNLIADHGLGYGDYWTVSDYAKSQEKRPMWMMLVAPALAGSPSFVPFMEHARKNEGRLVTPFDVYATMQHILSHPGPIPAFSSDRSSIFQLLPDHRTCHTLKIPPEWCTCTLFSSESQPKDKVDYDTLAAVASHYINQQAAQVHKTCRPLTASMIQKIEVDQTQRHYLVSFTVAPTSGKPLRQAETFEARFSVNSPSEATCGKTKACFGTPFTHPDKLMLNLRVGMRFDDASTVFHSVYGVIVQGELLWEYFSWSSDDEKHHKYDLAYSDDTGNIWESKTHVVNTGITSNWRWWQPSASDIKVGRHSLTVREKDGDKDLVGEFIFYVVKPPNRGSILKAPLMSMGKSTACAVQKTSDEPFIVLGSSSVQQKTELSLLQLWDKSVSFDSDDCTYTAEITSTCGDKSVAKKQICPGKHAPRESNLLRHLLGIIDDNNNSSTEGTSEAGSVLQAYGHADAGTILSTFPTSVCTRISEAACGGVWRHRVYNSVEQEIGQSLIFVGGESWGIPSDRSIIGDLDQESVSTLFQAFKITSVRRLSRYAPDEQCSPDGVEAQYCICASI